MGNLTIKKGGLNDAYQQLLAQGRSPSKLFHGNTRCDLKNASTLLGELKRCDASDGERDSFIYGETTCRTISVACNQIQRDHSYNQIRKAMNPHVVLSNWTGNFQVRFQAVNARRYPRHFERAVARVYYKYGWRTGELSQLIKTFRRKGNYPILFALGKKDETNSIAGMAPVYGPLRKTLGGVDIKSDIIYVAHLSQRSTLLKNLEVAAEHEYGHVKVYRALKAEGTGPINDDGDFWIRSLVLFKKQNPAEFRRIGPIFKELLKAVLARPSTLQVKKVVISRFYSSLHESAGAGARTQIPIPEVSTAEIIANYLGKDMKKFGSVDEKNSNYTNTEPAFIVTLPLFTQSLFLLKETGNITKKRLAEIDGWFKKGSKFHRWHKTMMTLHELAYQAGGKVRDQK